MTDSSPQPESRPEPHSGLGITGASGDMDALVSRLQVIEDQPLAQRAPAYMQLYDELRSALEGADNPA